MSAPVFKFMRLASTSGYTIDLRPDGSTTQPWTRCGALTLGCVKDGGSDCEMYVKPVSIADGAAAPSAPTSLADLYDAGSKVDVVYLNNALSPSAQIGVALPQGYDPTVHKIGYTHLLVWCIATGDIKVSG